MPLSFLLEPFRTDAHYQQYTHTHDTRLRKDMLHQGWQACIHNQPANVETVSLGDSFAFDFTKVVEESVGVGDDWSLELNPPVEGDELVTIGDSWVTELNP